MSMYRLVGQGFRNSLKNAPLARAQIGLLLLGLLLCVKDRVYETGWLGGPDPE